MVVFIFKQPSSAPQNLSLGISKPQISQPNGISDVSVKLSNLRNHRTIFWGIHDEKLLENLQKTQQGDDGIFHGLGAVTNRGIANQKDEEKGEHIYITILST